MKFASPFMDPEVIKRFDEEKLAPYRSMAPEQRAEILSSACRLAIALVNLQPDPRGSLRRRKPVSERTRQLLGRLRAEHGRNDHQR